MALGYWLFTSIFAQTNPFLLEMDDPQGDKAIVDDCEMVGKVMEFVLSLELTDEQRTNLVNIITDRIARLEKADQAFGYKLLAKRTNFELKGEAKKYDNLVKGLLNDFKNEVKRLEDKKNQNMMLKVKNQKLSWQLEMGIPDTIVEVGDLGMGPTHTDAKEHGNQRLQSRRHQHILQGSLLHGEYESEQEMEPLPAKKKRKKKIKENECTKVEKITNLIDSLGLSVNQLNRLKESLCDHKQKKQKRVEEKGYEFVSEQIDGSLKGISKSHSSLDDGLSDALIVVRKLFDIEVSENVKLKEQNQKLVWQLEILKHKTGNVVPDDGRNHNSDSMSQSRGHLQVSRGGHGPTPPTSYVDYQGSQYIGTDTEGSSLPTPAVIPASENHEGMLGSREVLEGNHNSVTMPQLRGHQQVHRGGLGPTPATSFGVTASSSKSKMPANEGFQSMQRRHGNFQGLVSQYHTGGTGTEGGSLPLTNAYNAPAPTPVMNPGVQQGSLSSATPQVANTAFGATSSAPAVIPASEGMLGSREMLEGNHNSVSSMPQLREQQQVHRGGRGPTPANSFGVTASSSNSTMGGHEGFQSMQENFQDTSMAYNGKTSTTNGQESFRNQIVETDNKITNAFPFAKQLIEQGLNNNQQFQQPYVPVMIPTPRNIFEKDGKLGREYSDDEMYELFNIEELLPQLLNPDSERNQEMPVFETNQTPNTFIGAPDFTSEGDLKRTE